MAGDLDAAAALVSESLRGLYDLGDSVAIARGLHFLAELAFRRGDVEEATGLCAGALESAREKGSRHEIGQCLEGLASVLLKCGDPVVGARLLGAADRIRKYLATPGFAWERQRIEALMADAGERLPPGVLEEARREGLTMIPEEAIRFALQNVPGAR